MSKLIFIKLHASSTSWRCTGKTLLVLENKEEQWNLWLRNTKKRGYSWKGSELKRAMASRICSIMKQDNGHPVLCQPQPPERCPLGLWGGLESGEGRITTGLWIPKPVICINRLSCKAFAELSVITDWLLKPQTMSLVSVLFLSPVF